MASKKRRKLSIAGMIIIGLTFVLVVFLLVLLMKYFFLDRNKTEHKDKVDKNPTSEVEKKDDEEISFDYGINFKDATYYVVDETDFNFVIAEVELNNISITYDLNDFITSDDIVLSEVNNYISLLNNQGIYPSLADVKTELPLKNNYFDGNIFIPIKNKNTKSISISYKDQKFDLKLDKQGDLSKLKYEQDSEITDNESFTLKITGVEKLSGIYLERNGEPYEIGSQTDLYGMMCDIKCLNNDPFEITSAYFEDNNGYVYEALDSSIKAFDTDNLVGLRILKASTGSLMFVVINPNSDKSTLYIGKLHIKLNNDAQEYIINVSLN